MNFTRFLSIGLLAAASSFASVKDLYFYQEDGHLCATNKSVFSPGYKSDGKLCNHAYLNNVRIRVIDAPQNPTRKFGFDVERPLLILDGIYLSTEGRRTLSEFYEETNQFGLPSLLSNLGYTPILVQFSETVEKSLEENAEYFTELLQFMNDNKLFGFANKESDGFIVLGISQGGILGRYGSYRYDINRKSGDAPIRLYGSMDSPHQGAIMPLSLLYTINFWATKGGSAAAEAFNDMVEGPGASGLLVNQTKNFSFHTGFVSVDSKSYGEDFSDKRFLFGEYRKAAEYKGFPAVLISQGQLKGKSPVHSKDFFKLNRKAEKAGVVMGRAESYLSSPGAESGDLVYNRVYQKFSTDDYQSIKSDAKFDFVQGSTYPFSKTMYESLKEGFEDAIPSNMNVSLFSVFGQNVGLSLSTSWDEDVLFQSKSTFIPTVSAMDYKCEGGLAMTKSCAFNLSHSGVPFEKPGSLSSGTSIYAVDPTHPRYNESISGRHIELPYVADGKIDTAVMRGMQTDIWRFLCETAKQDYDAKNNRYRNPNLEQFFTPGASCMDRTRIPDIVKNAGLLVSKPFAYARYDYKASATERNESVSFDLSAGWHKVAQFDNGSSIGAGSQFEVDIKVDNPKGNWMKAELLLSRGKNGANQLQLTEIPVTQNGKFQTLRWKMPFSKEASGDYRWIRLVLNSDGARVTLSNPRLVYSGAEMDPPQPIKSKVIFPNGDYSVSPWTASTNLTYTNPNGDLFMEASFKNFGSGLSILLGSFWELDWYSKLKVSYMPGTCQKTSVYFDSFRNGAHSLAGGVLRNGLMEVSIPLKELVDMQTTPGFTLSASRLSLIGNNSSEKCIVHRIDLEM